MGRTRLVLAPAAGLLAALAPLAPGQEKRAPTLPEKVKNAIEEGVRILLRLQEEDGAWTYQGVVGVPIGYKVGGTSIGALALLDGASPEDSAVGRAIERAKDFVLSGLDDPLMGPEFAGTYDTRVWGHAYALLFLCRLREAGRLEGKRAGSVDAGIRRLVVALERTALPEGGWNYSRPNRGARPSTFTTASAVQSLLLARAQGEKVSDEVLARARKALEAARMEDGGIVYGGAAEGRAAADPRAKIPGACARMAIYETTLRLVGGGSEKAVRGAVEAFFEHWGELDARRKKAGTHAGPYGIAPYYFFYGHLYAAQAIETLPESEREALRERLRALLFQVRDDDGSWNDRVFERSKAYGTAMAVLAFLSPRLPPVPPLGPPPNLKSPKK